MNRTARLVGIMLVLQTGRGTSVRELAGRFEVTRRTVYRDLADLAEAGFPLSTAAGRYAVPDGYRLTPTAFPASEAAALLLGGRLLRAIADGAITALVDAASARLEATLPPPVRYQAAQLLAAVRMRPTTGAARVGSPDLLSL